MVSQTSFNVRSIVDIFRIGNGKIVEHWDVIQEVPEKSANDHPMF
jgi:predicted SnoaL-like aldol condensation-catalyzing enzyme